MNDYKGAKVRKNSETDTLFRDLFLFYTLFLVCKGKDTYLCPEKELILILKICYELYKTSSISV